MGNNYPICQKCGDTYLIKNKTNMCPKCLEEIYLESKKQIKELKALLGKNSKDTTNGDKIRLMTDEELAQWLDKQHNDEREDWEPVGCYHCTSYRTHHTNKSYIGTEFEHLYECKNCEFKNGLLEWLKLKV